MEDFLEKAKKEGLKIEVQPKGERKVLIVERADGLKDVYEVTEDGEKILRMGGYKGL